MELSDRDALAPFQGLDNEEIMWLTPLYPQRFKLSYLSDGEEQPRVT